MNDYLKMLPIVGPIYLTSLAVCYDVGFFFGLGAAFFTIFSLTEHLLFALQAIPFALLPATTIGFAVFVPLYFHSTADARSARYLERFQAMTAAEQAQERSQLQTRQRWIKILDKPILAMQLTTITLMFWNGAYTAAIGISVSVVAVMLMYPVATFERRIALAAVAIFSGWLGAFALGYERSTALLKDNTPSEIVTVGLIDIPAKMIRAGEKGILLKTTDTGKVSYIRWDNIKKISSI